MTAEDAEVARLAIARYQRDLAEARAIIAEQKRMLVIARKYAVRAIYTYNEGYADHLVEIDRAIKMGDGT